MNGSTKRGIDWQHLQSSWHRKLLTGNHRQVEDLTGNVGVAELEVLHNALLPLLGHGVFPLSKNLSECLGRHGLAVVEALCAPAAMAL